MDTTHQRPNMTKQPMFKQDPDDHEGGYLLSMAGVLALMGSAAYEAGDAVTPKDLPTPIPSAFVSTRWPK